MKLIEIGTKKYVIEFNSNVIFNINKNGITYKKLAESFGEDMDIQGLYTAFYYSLKKHHDFTIEEALEVIDEYFANGNDIEDFAKLVLGEWAEAMGFGKQFRKAMKKEAKK